MPSRAPSRLFSHALTYSPSVFSALFGVIHPHF